MRNPFNETQVRIALAVSQAAANGKSHSKDVIAKAPYAVTLIDSMFTPYPGQGVIMSSTIDERQYNAINWALSEETQKYVSKSELSRIADMYIKQ